LICFFTLQTFFVNYLDIFYFAALTKAYPKEAVQAYHVKPAPTRSHVDHGAPNFIAGHMPPGLQQPRNQYFNNMRMRQARKYFISWKTIHKLITAS
jgi:hypothetical protein